MIKFIHKKHIHKAPNVKAFIIYYSLSDIVLGLLLIVLVAFFIYNYLQVSFKSPDGYNTKNITTAPSIYNPVTPKVPTQQKVRAK